MILLAPELLKTVNEDVKTIAKKIGENNVLIHSDIKNLFLFEFSSKFDLLDKHLRNIFEIFSGFNIWMPTFNYDFTKSGVYDTKLDKSQVGVLNDYFRTVCDWRTTTPVFNFCGNGKYPIKKIQSEEKIDPFSYGSEFHYLYKTNSLQCHYGSKFSASTLLHYVEKTSKKLLYRYSKIFSGIVINNNKTKKIFLDYHVSPMKIKVGYDWKKIYLDLLNDNLIYEFKIFNDVNYIMLFSVKEVSDYWINKLNNDPFYFVDEESKKWVIPKIEKLGRGFVLEDFE